MISQLCLKNIGVVIKYALPAILRDSGRGDGEGGAGHVLQWLALWVSIRRSSRLGNHPLGSGRVVWSVRGGQLGSQKPWRPKVGAVIRRGWRTPVGVRGRIRGMVGGRDSEADGSWKGGSGTWKGVDAAVGRCCRAFHKVGKVCIEISAYNRGRTRCRAPTTKGRGGERLGWARRAHLLRPTPRTKTYRT